MSLPDVDVDQLSARLLLIRAHLDERAWRLLLGAEAKVLGRGGIKVVAGAVKAHPDTVAQECGNWTIRTRFPGGSGARVGATCGGGHRPHIVGGAGRTGGPGDPR